MDINGRTLCTYCFEEKSNPQGPCLVCGYVEASGTPDTVLTPGTLLMGRYAVGMMLGRGGFGVTYLAYDMKRELRVAIKEYMPDSLAYRTPGNTTVTTYEGDKEENFRLGAEKFYEEARTVSRFNGHPNIINVQEFFYENNTAYFVMEYVVGVNLKSYVAQHGGAISQEECIRLLVPVMDALIVVHSVGILHRDISPDNIYVTKDGGVKLLDFGAARQVLSEKSKSLSVVLKPGFAPIEQYQTRGKQGQWTDVYALAATFYYCLTGQVPEAAMDRIYDDRFRKPAELNTGISQRMAEALTKALEVKAESRYKTVYEFKQAIVDIEEIIEPEHVQNGMNKGNVPLQANNGKNVERALPAKAGEITGKKKYIIPVVAAVLILLIGTGVSALLRQGVTEANNNSAGGVAFAPANETSSNATTSTTSDINEYFPVDSSQTTVETNQSSEDIYKTLGSSLSSRANQGNYVIVQPNTLVEPENFVGFIIEEINELKIPNEDSNVILQVRLKLKKTNSYTGTIGMADYDFVFLEQHTSEITGKQAVTTLYPGGFSYAGSDNVETFPLVIDSYDPIEINLYYKAPVNSERRLVFVGTNYFNGKEAGPIYLYEYIPNSTQIEGSGNDVATQAESSNTVDINDYIIPYSSDRYLTEADLSNLSIEELGIARNEIYARHGYIFVTEKYKDYFSNKAWYSPNPSFKESGLSDVEKFNLTFIKKYEGQ